jgi:hypothetical protein
MVFSICWNQGYSQLKEIVDTEGFIPMGAKSRQEHLVHFFSCWKQKKICKNRFFFCCRKRGACTRKVYMLMISEVVHSNYKPRIFFIKFIANSSARLRSLAFGLPLFIPPKNFRKLFVLKPGHMNSSTTV